MHGEMIICIKCPHGKETEKIRKRNMFFTRERKSGRQKIKELKNKNKNRKVEK